MAEYKDDFVLHECIDYVSTDKMLYMSITYDYNDLEWKNTSELILKQIIVTQNGKPVLNQRKRIDNLSDEIRKQFDYLSKQRSVSGIYLIDERDHSNCSEKLKGWPFKPHHRELIRNELKIKEG